MARPDLEAAHDLSRAVGWPHRIEDWAMLLSVGRGVVATDRGTGRVLGTAMTWPFGRCAAGLGMVIVAPDRQGEGIGRRLTTAAMAMAGTPALQLTATAAGLPLYRALGFVETGRILQIQGPWDAGRGATSARPLRPADAAAVKALDRAAGGLDRGAILDVLLAAGQATVLPGDRGPAGFAIRRRFGAGHVIGPLVAPDEVAAIALVEATAGDGFTRLDVPEEAGILIRHLERNGLAVVDRPTRMRRGPPPGRPQAAARPYALISQALG